MKQKMNILIPMAGSGSRFKKEGYVDSKPFINVNGVPMIKRVIDSLDIEFNNNFKLIFICLKDDYIKYNMEHKFNSLLGIDTEIEFVIVDRKTEGAAQSVLLAKSIIDNNTPLLILNSDQTIKYNPQKSFDFFEKFDGGLLTFKGSGIEWSYAKTNEDGYVIEVAEKKQISNDATAGYYYWKRGSDFVRYAEEMIDNNDRVNNEFYVAPVYNYAIKDGKKIVISEVEEITQLGTPDWLNIYLNNGNF